MSTTMVYMDKVCIEINGKIYHVSKEECENQLSMKGYIPPFSNEQYEKMAKQIVYATGDKYLVKR